MSKVNIECPAQRIDQYRDKIVRYLRKRVPRHCVEDFAQETLLNAYAYLSNGNKLDKPLAFLYQTANNVVRQNHRDQKTAAVTDAVANIDELEGKVGMPSVEQTVMSELEFEAMCVAIGRLPDKCRKAFVLRKVYQYSYREIAEECGVSVDTVRNHVVTGLKLVHKYYKQRERLLCARDTS
jgi:RNA polymerase sigma-70 factor (ECF subfamily)